MSQWMRVLDLKDDWEAIKDAELTRLVLRKLAQTIIDKLNKLKPFNIPHVDCEKQEILQDFCDFIKEDNQSIYDFDLILGRLYDYGDVRLDGKWNGAKVMWVKTF